MQRLATLSTLLSSDPVVTHGPARSGHRYPQETSIEKPLTLNGPDSRPGACCAQFPVSLLFGENHRDNPWEGE